MNDPSLSYAVLPWDSDFFEFTVARIHNADIPNPPIPEWIAALRDHGVTLAYWPSQHRLADNTVRENTGQLVDCKTTFVARLDPTEHALEPDVVPYSNSMPIEDFDLLAIQAGESSRFARDRKILRTKFEQLYTIWIRKSLSKEIADETLVICDQNRPVGMITLRHLDSMGEIGLVAVAETHRGLGYGRRLMNGALQWFKNRRCDEVRVVTQGHNEAACRLYARSGFIIESVEFYYHFWPLSTP